VTASGSGAEAAAVAGTGTEEGEVTLPPQQLLSQAEGLLREAEGMLAAGSAAPSSSASASGSGAGVALDAAPYTALMAAYNRRGSPHRALRLYRRMRRRGVEPSASVLTQVLLACRRTMDAGGVYQALRLLRSKGWNLRPERGLYQAALTACYCEGDEEMGRGLREEALRLHGMEVGGEEEVLERALKWGVAVTPSMSSSSQQQGGGRRGEGNDAVLLRVGRRRKGGVGVLRRQ
jgi:pentatricopeptide repeat protein